MKLNSQFWLFSSYIWRRERGDMCRSSGIKMEIRRLVLGPVFLLWSWARHFLSVLAYSSIDLEAQENGIQGSLLLRVLLMKPVVNRMVVCKIVVPSKIVAPFGISVYWKLFRNNKVAWNLSFTESSNVVTQCSYLTLLEELIHIKFVRDLNSNHSWDTPKKNFF